MKVGDKVRVIAAGSSLRGREGTIVRFADDDFVMPWWVDLGRAIQAWPFDDYELEVIEEAPDND